MLKTVRIALLCCLVSLWACSAPVRPPASASANQAASAIEPKVVLQLGHQQPVLAVSWLKGGTVLASLDQSGEIVFWDVARRVVLDRAFLPGGGEDAFAGAMFGPTRTGPGGAELTVLQRQGGASGAAPAQARADAPPERQRRFSINLASRAVVDDGAVAPTAAALDRFPVSPDGKWRPQPNHGDGQGGLFDQTDEHLQFTDSSCVEQGRCRYGVNLVPANVEGEPIKLFGEPRSYFSDADLSPDGKTLLRIEPLDNRTQERIQTLDLIDGAAPNPFVPRGAYHRARWTGQDRYLLSSKGYAATDDTPDAIGFPPQLSVDPGCARNGACPQSPSYAMVQPLNDQGGFIGVGSQEGCYVSRYGHTFCPGADQEPAPVLSIKPDPGSPWQLMEQPAWGNQVITAIRVSPDHTRLAVATREFRDLDKPQPTRLVRLWLFDLVENQLQANPRNVLTISGAFHPSDQGPNEGMPERGVIGPVYFTADAISFSSDSSRVVFTRTANSASEPSDLYIADLTSPAPPRRITGFSDSAIALGNGRVFGLEQRQLLHYAKSDAIIPLERQPGEGFIENAGWIERAQLVWYATNDGVIRFVDGDTGALQLTFYALPDNRFFAVAPGGRYDTNLGPDTRTIRWLMPDAPWQSLAAQTFMRDFYEPGLYGKLLGCRAALSCGQVFKPLPAMAELNRVMPEVRITGVAPGKDASEALVRIDVSEGVDPAAANGKTHSGIFNPRLFRNGRVVAMNPDEPDAVTDTLEKWRSLNDVAKRAGPDGVLHYQFTVPLPTGAGTETQEFSAYAFNEDRIKSETASFTYTRPPIAPRRPKAFVVTIGIDDYDTPRFKLNYSVADARLIASRLESIPGYEMRRLTLAGERLPDGTRKRVDNITISRVLSLLMTNHGREQGLAALANEDKVDAVMLEEATPDDIVIISFSGHGWADPQGNFYLIPTNGYWLDGTDKPELRSIFATAELAMFFRAMNAADITLIIDACHSSASVAAGGFKPGPMGDSGLGQLAYDKGIRILAATQANDVAMEDARLKQGLLTYALAAEGLTASGGLADLDGDRTIHLDEWLRYAVQRMPALALDRRVGEISAEQGNARSVTFHDLPPNASKRQVQQPSLFDFNRGQSSILLKRVGR